MSCLNDVDIFVGDEGKQIEIQTKLDPADAASSGHKLYIDKLLDRNADTWEQRAELNATKLSVDPATLVIGATPGAGVYDTKGTYAVRGLIAAPGGGKPLLTRPAEFEVGRGLAPAPT